MDETLIDDSKISMKKVMSKKTKGMLLSLVGVVTAAAIAAGSICAWLGINKNKERQRVNNLIGAYSTSEYCKFPSVVVTSKGYDSLVCSGTSLVEQLNENNIKYCQILDEYYTADGCELVKLTALVDCVKITKATEVVAADGTKFYSTPEGGILVGNEAHFHTTYTVTKVVVANPDGDYSDVVFSVPDGMVGGTPEVVVVESIPSKPYSEIVNQDFIIDISDDAKPVDNLYNGTLKLVPRN